MKKFTLDKYSLPFNFFDVVGFSYKEVAINCIKQKYSHLTKIECENIFEDNIDDINQIMYELNDSNALNDNWVGDDEVEEATGTWGYSDYEVVDIEMVCLDLEKEVSVLMEEFLKEIDLQR